jgi:hypothetical protein
MQIQTFAVQKGHVFARHHSKRRLFQFQSIRHVGLELLFENQNVALPPFIKCAKKDSKTTKREEEFPKCL